MVTKKYKPCQDHLGNWYASAESMCKNYNVSLSTFYYRIKNGYSLEEALFDSDKYRGRSKKCQDHEGNWFDSVEDKCASYGIPKSTYYSRIRSGCSEKEALSNVTEPIKYNKGKTVTDHLGRVFESVTAMCRYHDVDISTYYAKLRESGSPGEAIVKSMKVRRHSNK